MITRNGATGKLELEASEEGHGSCRGSAGGRKVENMATFWLTWPKNCYRKSPEKITS